MTCTHLVQRGLGGEAVGAVKVSDAKLTRSEVIEVFMRHVEGRY